MTEENNISDQELGQMTPQEWEASHRMESDGLNVSGGYNPDFPADVENHVPEPKGQYNEVEKFAGYRPYMSEKGQQHENFYNKDTYQNLPVERRRPVFDVGHQHAQVVELSPLVKAYARFTNEQTIFLETGAGLTGSEYQQALWRYSKEQTLLIRAQAEALRQAGVL